MTAARPQMPITAIKPCIQTQPAYLVTAMEER